MPIKIKRIYEGYNPDDGQRILVDRIWPRGVSKEAAHLDEWLKELAPSTDLRDWFGHIPERFDEFCERYHAELDQNPTAQADIRQILEKARAGRSPWFIPPKIPSTTRRSRCWRISRRKPRARNSGRLLT